MKIQNDSDNIETNNLNANDILAEKPKYSNKNIALKLLSLKIVAFLKWDLGN